MPAETVRDVGVERAGPADVARHRGEPDREQKQHDRADAVRGGERGAVTRRDTDRERARDHGQRRGGRDDHEHDRGRAELARQAVGLAPGAHPQNCVS